MQENVSSIPVGGQPVGYEILWFWLGIPTLVVWVQLTLGWNTYLLFKFDVVNFVWKTDEGKAGSIILLIFLSFEGALIVNGWRLVGWGRKSHLGPAQVASFCFCFFFFFYELVRLKLGAWAVSVFCSPLWRTKQKQLVFQDLFGELLNSHLRKLGNELATFEIKSYRKKLHQIFNKLHQTETACKIIQKKTTPNFLNEKITPNF